MTKSDITHDIVAKIATALRRRIGYAQTDKEAQDDLLRIDRLRGRGRISLGLYEDCMRQAIANPYLSEDLKERISKEKLKKPTEIDISPLLASRVEDLAAYDSHKVLAPQSAIHHASGGCWQDIGSNEMSNFLAQVSPVDGVFETSSETTVCQIIPLPWFEAVNLVRVFDPSWTISDLVIYYLAYEGAVYRLDGTSPPIHEVNKKTSLRLTEDNALDYLRFFCFFVRGDEGPFYLLESMDDPFVLSLGTLEPTVEEILAAAAHPLDKLTLDEKGNFVCTATIFYSNAVFKAEMSLQPNGIVEMLDDNPISADLPVRIVAPIGYKVK